MGDFPPVWWPRFPPPWDVPAFCSPVLLRFGVSLPFGSPICLRFGISLPFWDFPPLRRGREIPNRSISPRTEGFDRVLHRPALAAQPPDTAGACVNPAVFVASKDPGCEWRGMRAVSLCLLKGLPGVTSGVTPVTRNGNFGASEALGDLNARFLAGWSLGGPGATEGIDSTAGRLGPPPRQLGRAAQEIGNTGGLAQSGGSRGGGGLAYLLGNTGRLAQAAGSAGRGRLGLPPRQHGPVGPSRRQPGRSGPPHRELARPDRLGPQNTAGRRVRAATTGKGCLRGQSIRARLAWPPVPVHH